MSDVIKCPCGPHKGPLCAISNKGLFYSHGCLQSVFWPETPKKNQPYICILESGILFTMQNSYTPIAALNIENKIKKCVFIYWTCSFTVWQRSSASRQHCWDEVGNMLVSSAVYRASEHINSSSLPVSWHIVKIVALNQRDFPKEQNIQSKQKHQGSVHTSHDSHQRISVQKHFWHLKWGGCAWNLAYNTVSQPHPTDLSFDLIYFFMSPKQDIIKLKLKHCINTESSL